MSQGHSTWRHTHTHTRICTHHMMFFSLPPWVVFPEISLGHYIKTAQNEMSNVAQGRKLTCIILVSLSPPQSILKANQGPFSGVFPQHPVCPTDPGVVAGLKVWPWIDSQVLPPPLMPQGFWRPGRFARPLLFPSLFRSKCMPPLTATTIMNGC